MNRPARHSCVLAFAVLMLGAPLALLAAEPGRAIEDLRAFAKLYGYVRYFHPSDEASAIDWDRFAIHGASRIRQLSGDAALAPALESLFLPIAPSVRIRSSGEPPPAPAGLVPESTEGLEVVAWQHAGLGLGAGVPSSGDIYRSVRLNRKPPVARGPGFGTVTQGIDATPHRGKQVRLAARVKAEVEGDGNQAQLWLRVDRVGTERGFFDNMGDRPITSAQWGSYEIVGTIAPDAKEVYFGGFLRGSGKALLDDFALSVRVPGGAWTAVPIENPGFESGESGQAPSGWAARSEGYRAVGQKEAGAGGERAVVITNIVASPATPLFDAQPKPGDAADVRLGRGLAARIPLALYSRDGQTLPPADPQKLGALRSALDKVSVATATAADPDVRITGVVIAWNVLQHFYPYFDVVGADWDSVLTESLARATKDGTPEEYQETLSWMTAQLRDGHASVYHPAIAEAQGRLPFVADWIEGKVVVVAAAADSPFRRGDVVKAIDGTAAGDLLARKESLRSGSAQWVRFRALDDLARGAKDSQARVTIDRAGATLDVEAKRNSSARISESRPENFAELRPGVFYVDLGTAEIADINAHIQELAAARGVVFDLRGYPKGNHAVLQHLTGKPIQSARWQVPRIIYPDRERLAGYREDGRWQLEPATPRIAGKVAFLTDGRAISYAESVMGIVEHYRLGEIVGQPTAGTNGNVNRFTVPGGFQILWTGMRVIKHDGSQHHLIGIKPTVPAGRTIEGVRAGRDEVLEKALALFDGPAAR